MNYKTLNSINFHSNPYWDYIIDEYSLNDKTYKYYYVKSKGSVMIIPKLEDKYILVNQFRYLNQKNSLEFPGGGNCLNLSILENAKKELLEETGFAANKITFIGEFNPFNGVTDEICSVFLAEELEKKKQQLDETENIDVTLLDKFEIVNYIKNKIIWDGMTLASWSIYSNF